MGKVNEKVELVNYQDKIEAKLGLKKENRIRKIIIENALIDSGATMLMIPKKIIKQLGLEQRGSILVKDANGNSVTRKAQLY